MLSANPSLLAGSGISGILHKAAGKELEKAAKALGPIKPGMAVITPAFDLSAKYIVHTVCPRYIKGSGKKKEELAGAYCSALSFYDQLDDVESIAFVSMGTGIYKWPLDLDAEIAVSELVKSKFNETTMYVIDDATRSMYQYAHDSLKQVLSNDPP